MGGDHLWDAVAAIGESVGALAVVVTIGVLIWQLRQNTLALRVSLERESVSSLSDIQQQMMNPDIAEAISRAFIDDSRSLTPAEMVPIENVMLALLFVYQQDYLDYRRGFMSDEVWAARTSFLQNVFVSRSIRIWWSTIGRNHVVPDFRTVVDEIVAKADERGGEYWKPFTDAS